MITQEQLGTLVVRQVIFHDVPNGIRGVVNRQPVLSDVITDLQVDRKKLLRDRLVEALGSSKAWPVVFSPITGSSVPAEVRNLTTQGGLGNFVEVSRKLAAELFDKQVGSVSPGLLCMIDIAVDSRPGIALMKLEREEGAQLKLKGESGKQTFAMEILGDLVLTENTRLFKSAMFVRSGLGDDDFISKVCDSQGPGTVDDLARFWMAFLGCSFADNPRISTQRFFNSTMSFINQSVTEPVEKSDLYDALHVELKSSRNTFSPKAFLEEHLPDSYRRQFKEHLTADSIPLSAFKKDVQDINNRLKRHVYMTRSGAMVSVPESQLGMLEVGEDSILVKDMVTRVK